MAIPKPMRAYVNTFGDVTKEILTCCCAQGVASGYVEGWLRTMKDGNELRLREIEERKANY